MFADIVNYKTEELHVPYVKRELIIA